MIAASSAGVISPTPPPPPPPPPPQQPRSHRVRGLSFLRRPRGNTPSPPVSPPINSHLDRTTSYPLNAAAASSSSVLAADPQQPNYSQPSSVPAARSASSGPASTTQTAPNNHLHPSTPKASTLAPEPSSMARLRRAFSSQNGASPQQHPPSTSIQAPHPHATSTASPQHNMESTFATTAQPTSVQTPDAPTTNTNGRDGLAPDAMPTIKFIPHQDPRAAKPSLAFAVTSRTLPHEDCVIRVGRYSERDGIQNPPVGVPSAAPVGFKSKVVSRKHCEFWCSQGQWYIKDVKSSSGTFLNHIRLSQPNTESRPFPINDGDVVQLGIDFKGGEEAIFRCVKIRVECNRNWQRKLNDFNMNTHKKLRELNQKTAPGTEGNDKSECSICLMQIAPCQSLFVAPCSHVWHYKCIRPLLNDHKMYPQFMCPNCRAVCDLEADIDEVPNTWDEDQELEDEEQEQEQATDDKDKTQVVGSKDATESAAMAPTAHSQTAELADTTRVADVSSAVAAMELGDTSIDAALHSSTQPIEVPGTSSQHLRASTPAEAELDGREGPLTPRNDVGPFIFDGSAGRGSVRKTAPATAPAADQEEEL